MEEIYAALLLDSTGQKVDEAGLKKILEAAGQKPEGARLKALVASLDGVDIKEVIKQAAFAPVAAAVPAQATESKEEKKEDNAEEKAEEAAAGLGSLFG